MPTINKLPKKKRIYQNTDKRKIRQDIYKTKTWKDLRISHLINNPLDEIDLINGITTPGIDVHHIVSFVNVEDINERKRLAYDSDNLITLSKENHQKMHNDPAFKKKWTEYFLKSKQSKEEIITFDFTF